MSKLSSSKFCHSTQSSLDALIVALLCKLPQMPSCSTNNANFNKTNFDMFYKIDCCAAIHGRIWMNNVLLYLFQFRELWSQTRVPFYATQSSYTYSKLGGGGVILICFTKIIAEQSSVIQYAWPMCHMKEK